MTIKAFKDFTKTHRQQPFDPPEISRKQALSNRRWFLKYASIAALLYYFSDHFSLGSRMTHRLSISLGNGDCLWTEGIALPLDSDPYGTLLASYPSAGMRDLWKQVEGLTGIKVGDAYWYGGKRVGIIKTQYPHYEGIWSYGDTLDQVILLVRNPRWNIPAFHHYLHEVNYGQTFEEVSEYIYEIFSERSPLEDWVKWRDLNFENELNLWSYFIDFYMEGGPQYWHDLDFHRVGHKPLYYRNETDRPWPIDPRCSDCMDCVPTAVISYERLKNETTGPQELIKIADVLRDKKNMTVIDEESIACVWSETWTHNTAPSDADRGGLGESEFGFTNAQMEQILVQLEETKNKYSSGSWVDNAVAADLVSAVEMYIDEVSEELEILEVSPAPTPPSDPGYYDSLVDWYKDLGKGDRYNTDLARTHPGFWDQVKYLYGDDAEDLDYLPSDAPKEQLGAQVSEPC